MGFDSKRCKGGQNGAKERISALCRSRRELSNEYFCANLASIQPRTILLKFARSPRTDPQGLLDRDETATTDRDSELGKDCDSADEKDPSREMIAFLRQTRILTNRIL